MPVSLIPVFGFCLSACLPVCVCVCVCVCVFCLFVSLPVLRMRSWVHRCIEYLDLPNPCEIVEIARAHLLAHRVHPTALCHYRRGQ